jgi:hypothetical protein
MLALFSTLDFPVPNLTWFLPQYNVATEHPTIV